MEKSQSQPSRKGYLNPMYGKRHGEDTRKRISNSQKQRYNVIRKTIKEANILSYSPDDLEAHKSILKQCLTSNHLSFESIKQAINFLSVILCRDNFKDIIENEIEKILSE